MATTCRTHAFRRPGRTSLWVLSTSKEGKPLRLTFPTQEKPFTNSLDTVRPEEASVSATVVGLRENVAFWALNELSPH